MNDYREVRITIDPFSEDAADYLSAFLADIGYESFVTEKPCLTAWIPQNLFDENQLDMVLSNFPMEVNLSETDSFIEGKDWNEEWEKNYFKPIVISDLCVIHSTFHHDVPKTKYDIVIDPKMAFGTGHHSTTALILGFLLSMPLAEKSIIDMGTGTGILAILAKMRGACYVAGIEIDKTAYENAIENAKLNDVDIRLIHGDASNLNEAKCNPDGVDLLIANINRNIVLTDMGSYVEALNHDGELILSGFYTEDIPLIEKRAGMLGYKVSESHSDDNWAAVRLTRVND